MGRGGWGSALRCLCIWRRGERWRLVGSVPEGAARVSHRPPPRQVRLPPPCLFQPGQRRGCRLPATRSALPASPVGGGPSSEPGLRAARCCPLRAGSGAGGATGPAAGGGCAACGGAATRRGSGARPPGHGPEEGRREAARRRRGGSTRAWVAGCPRKWGLLARVAGAAVSWTPSGCSTRLDCGAVVQVCHLGLLPEEKKLSG